MILNHLEKLNVYIFTKLVSKNWFQKIFLNSINKKLRSAIYYVFNLFFLPYFHRSCSSQLRNISGDTQVFFITRHDFGNFILTLHYISCWQRQRGKTCLVILTSKFSLVKELAKTISPDTTLIFPNHFLTNLAVLFFGVNHVHYQTIMPVYARLVIDIPNALYIFSQTSLIKSNMHRSEHSPYFDPALASGKEIFSPEFCQSYLDVRKILDYRLNVYIDSIQLHYNSDLSKPLIS